MSTTEANAKTLQVGPDLVTWDGERVCIDAVREMPDWAVREYNRIPIYFQDRKYFLRIKQPGQRPYKVRYLLEPWPADHATSARASFAYDEQTVAERDADHKTGQFNEFIGRILYVVYPFLGLLWAGTKDKLIRFGFVPRTITGVSVGTTFFLMFLEGVFAGRLQMGLFTLIFSKPILDLGGLDIPVVFLDYGLVLVLLVDCIFRYDALLRESAIEWGFFEWVKRPFLRKKATVMVNGAEIPEETVQAALKEKAPPAATDDGPRKAA